MWKKCFNLCVLLTMGTIGKRTIYNGVMRKGKRLIQTVIKLSDLRLEFYSLTLKYWPNKVNRSFLLFARVSGFCINV